jgi:chromosome segregation ATPase
MIEERPVVVEEGGSPNWLIPSIALVAVLALVALWMGWKASTYAQDSRQSLNSDITTLKQSYAKDMQQVQQELATTEKSNTDLGGELSVVTKRLRITQGELKKARTEAEQIREADAQQLAAMDTTVKTELATKASTDDVKAVSGEVTGVRTDLDSTKKDVQMARSELGTLIAKNHDEISELRRMGERDYIEFTIVKKNTPTKVGNVTVELRSTNPKRNQFNLALVVEDKRTEQRNKSINEPIFFYLHGSHQPLELVVNQVDKNKVSGYLSVPKANAQSASGSNGGN